MKPNATVQATIDRLVSEFDEGMWAGYEAAFAPVPEWYRAKTLRDLTPWQRGYAFGREARVQGLGL